MIRRPPSITLSETPLPSTTLFRSAFAGQSFRKRSEGSLGPIGGARLEGEAEERDLSPPPPLNHLEGPVDVAVVAREDGGHHWQLQVRRFRQLGDGAQLLRQAGAAEGEARPQVGRRKDEVELLAERSEERRVGQECVSTLRYRWVANHKKTTDKQRLRTANT